MKPGRKQSGFTLIELLLALALVAMLVVAMNMFIFSMGELWGRGSDQRLFDRHVRAVTHYLEEMFRTAAMTPIGSTAPAAGGVAESATIAPAEIKTPQGSADELLTFELPQGTRILNWPEQPLPDVVCSLAVHEGEGLLLYWHSRVESHFDLDPPRSTPVSPFVTALSYEYYDADFKRWHTETTLQKNNAGQWIAPTRLRLKFSHAKLEREVVIPLPATPQQGLPVF